jgi:integrase/recombinase XerD
MMGSELVEIKGREVAGQGSGFVLPALIDQAGPRAGKRFVEFFTADIRNPNTREAYARAVARFLEWCEARGLDLSNIEPLHVAAYIEGLQSGLSKPSVKQHLAALKRLFDWLVTGQVIPMNPASSVRGPKHLVRKGKTPVLMGEEARELLASIDTTTVTGLRDRALIALMVYSFARVGAALAMKVEDYYLERKRGKVRLHEKGGKVITMPTHHNAEAFLDDYIEAAGIADDRKGPIFRTIGKNRKLSGNAMTRNDALRMIKRRVGAAGLPPEVCCHTFRATGITVFMQNGGKLERAQEMAGHADPRTTGLYNRVDDEITLDEVERIVL